MLKFIQRSKKFLFHQNFYCFKKVKIETELGLFKGNVNDQGLPQGKGEIEFKGINEGEKYVGEFVEGKIEGDGVLYFSEKEESKKMFKGRFENGKKVGEGIVVFRDGSVVRVSFDDEGEEIERSDRVGPSCVCMWGTGDE